MANNAGDPGPPIISATRDQIGMLTTLLTDREAAALLHVSIKCM